GVPPGTASCVRSEGLDARSALTREVRTRTDRLVAVMGVEPIIQALDQGADVVIAGRSGDSCLFAVPAIRAGFPEAAAYYLGQVLECASFAAEPFMGNLFYARLPEVRGTAGTAALMMDEVLRGKPGYEWTG